MHLSKEVCVGVALATQRKLIPAAVGGDIGCGMAAVAFDAAADVLSNAREAAAVLDGLVGAIPVMRHRRSAAGPLPPELQHHLLSCEQLETRKAREAALQFGTLGRGNHFLEFQADEHDRLWLMVRIPRP
ncbi:MAG: RtcB family protein [Nannocystales bacterium]